QDPRRELTKGGVIARWRQHGVPNVVDEVEVRIVNPDGVAEIERPEPDLLAIAGHQMQALLERLDDALRTTAAGGARAVLKDVDRAYVQRCLLALGVEEERVHCGQLFEEGRAFNHC